MRQGTAIRFLAAMPWTALIGALLLLLAGAAATLYEEHLYQTQRAAGLRQQAEILAASVTAAVSFGDRGAAEEYVGPMQVNPEIEAAGVYSHDGLLLAGFDRAGRLPQHLVGAGGPETGPQSVLVPVVEQHTPLGTVYVRGSVEPVENRLSRYAFLVLLGVMAALVVAGLANAQAKLQRQASDLAESNHRLQEEMAERAKAEDALRQSQKMEAIGQLSGGIAHDFNNHLMIIKGNLHFLQRKAGLADSDRHVAGAMEGISRAAALTQRILGFSRRQALSPSAVDLNELIGSMAQLIRTSLPENIDVHYDLRAASLVVLDRNQMENVILNLVINARDAMQDGGALFLVTQDTCLDEASGARDGFVQFTVRDTGCGMSPDVRAKALDPFFTTKPVGQGTGLGLSTTYGFITQSGGRMKIDSMPRQGTTIEISLPRHAPNAGANPDRSA